MTTVLYATLLAQPYVPPADPGLQLVPAARASAATIEENRISYAKDHRIYNNHTNMDNALKLQIIDSVNEVYLSKVCNKYTGYLGVTTRDLLDHLLNRYDKITPCDIEDCKKKMNEPIDNTQPIDVYFQGMDDCVQYAADGHVAFTTNQILQTVYHGVSTSGRYKDARKEWRKKQPADKTWPMFRCFFAAKYHNLKEQQQINGGQTNYHGANHTYEVNHTQEISNALDNLAMATTADNSMVTQLTTTNAELIKAVTLLKTQLQTALATDDVLIKKIGTNGNTNSTTNHRASNTEYDPNGYCHTHGYRVTKAHTSASNSKQHHEWIDQRKAQMTIRGRHKRR